MRQNRPSQDRPSDRRPGGSQAALEHPRVSARWILGGLLGTVLLAAVCAYSTLCLLYWQGQWQVVFHPSGTVSNTPASVGLAYDDIRFGATETGVLQLTGWWIPATGDGNPDKRQENGTLLLLHDGSGSLSSSLPQIKILHQLGINIFAFDYRGFGASAKIHPSEGATYQDADSAWSYLTDTRHLAPRSIVLYGKGLGGVVAVECALRHPQAAAAILEDLRPPTLRLLAENPQLRWLPYRLLFHDRFDPAARLERLHLPKLFLSSSGKAPLYYDAAAEPKAEVVTSSSDLAEDPRYLPAIRHFLDTYLSGNP